MNEFSPALEQAPSPKDEPTSKLDSFSYDDQIVRMFALATLVWSLVATLVGLIVAILLVMP